jgi:hypothetical protein
MKFRSMNLLHALVLLAPLVLTVGCRNNDEGGDCKKDKECNGLKKCDNGTCRLFPNDTSNSVSSAVSVGVSGPHTTGFTHP